MCGKFKSGRGRSASPHFFILDIADWADQADFLAWRPLLLIFPPSAWYHSYEIKNIWPQGQKISMISMIRPIQVKNSEAKPNPLSYPFSKTKKSETLRSRCGFSTRCRSTQPSGTSTLKRRCRKCGNMLLPYSSSSEEKIITQRFDN